MKNQNLQGEFELKDSLVTDFANAMECSKSLILGLKKLTNITSTYITHEAKDIFVGNIDCRYCGQFYNNQAVWVGLYFNNVIFTHDYKLVLAIWDKAGENNIKQELSKAFISYKSQNYVHNEEHWLFVILDNYLLNCDVDTAKEEISSKISSILQTTE